MSIERREDSGSELSEDLTGSRRAPAGLSMNRVRAIVAASAMSVLGIGGYVGCGGIAVIDGENSDAGVKDAGADVDAGDCDSLKMKVVKEVNPVPVYPIGSNDVVWTCWIFNNGCKSRTVELITLHRSGAGVSSDFENVTLWHDNIIAGPSVFDNNNELMFEDSWSLPADSSYLVCLTLDIAENADAWNQHYVSIDAPGDVKFDSPVQVEGDFPLKGFPLTISD